MKINFFILKKKHLIIAFLISLAFLLLNIVSSIILSKLINVSLGHQNHFRSKKVEFIIAIVIAPLFETLFFQALVIYQVFESYSGRYKKEIAIIVSSLLFGSIHYYSLYYFLFATIAGLFLAYIFCYFREKTNYLMAFIYLTLIHMLSNLYIFLLKTF